MSRCFPFPPPGYQRKARHDDEDLLEKEKHRDKKQKKEKKDKDKRDGKEKKDKDRSDGKHREKKDRKEKHKDRDKSRSKDKDRDKDKKRDKEKETDILKDKSKAPDEKRFSGQPDFHGGEKLGQKDSREKYNNVDKKNSVRSGDHKAEKLTQNTNLVEESKMVKDFGCTIKDDAAGIGNHVENLSVLDGKYDEGMLRSVAKNTTLAAVKEKDKRAEVKPTELQGTRDVIRPGGNAMVPSIAKTTPNKFEAPPRLLDNKNTERKMEGNENPKDKESDDKRVLKSQEKDEEKKSHGKDKDRDRDKKKEDREKKKEDREKRKEDKQKKKDEKQRKKEEKEKKKEAKEREKEKTQTQAQITELNKVKGINQHDIVNNHASKTLHQPPKHTNSVTPSDANPKKRKDYETNGVVHAQDHLLTPSGSIEMQKPPTSSSHPQLENGRILEHCQSSALAPDKKVISNKHHKINGVIETQKPSVSPMKVRPATPMTNQLAKPPPVRLPHPDTKYLSQIYSVPKMEEFSCYGDDDEEEWLFDSVSSQPKRPKVNLLGSEETPQVWAEAREIESADIFALPYVVPY